MLVDRSPGATVGTPLLRENTSVPDQNFAAGNRSVGRNKSELSSLERTVAQEREICEAAERPVPRQLRRNTAGVGMLRMIFGGGMVLFGAFGTAGSILLAALGIIPATELLVIIPVAAITTIVPGLVIFESGSRSRGAAKKFRASEPSTTQTAVRETKTHRPPKDEEKPGTSKVSALKVGLGAAVAGTVICFIAELLDQSLFSNPEVTFVVANIIGFFGLWAGSVTSVGRKILGLLDKDNPEKESWKRTFGVSTLLAAGISSITMGLIEACDYCLECVYSFLPGLHGGSSQCAPVNFATGAIEPSLYIFGILETVFVIFFSIAKMDWKEGGGGGGGDIAIPRRPDWIPGDDSNWFPVNR